MNNKIRKPKEQERKESRKDGPLLINCTLRDYDYRAEVRRKLPTSSRDPNSFLLPSVLIRDVGDLVGDDHARGARLHRGRLKERDHVLEIVATLVGDDRAGGGVGFRVDVGLSLAVIGLRLGFCL